MNSGSYYEFPAGSLWRRNLGGRHGWIATGWAAPAAAGRLAWNAGLVSGQLSPDGRDGATDLPARKIAAGAMDGRRGLGGDADPAAGSFFQRVFPGRVPEHGSRS